MAIQQRSGSVSWSASMVCSGDPAVTYPQRFTMRWTWISTPMLGALQAMPSARLAHSGPNAGEAAHQLLVGSAPPGRSATCVAMARICCAFRS